MNESVLFKQEALGQLQALERFALHLCQDAQRSRDLVQETMLKACKHFRTYRQGTNCRAWLFQICKNCYINAYHRRQRDPFLVDFQDASHSTMTGSDDAEYTSLHSLLRDDSHMKVQENWLSDDVLVALHRLPDVYRTAVILSDIEEHPHEEIAEFLQIPIGTVRSRIHRGRKMLATLLADYQP